MSVQYLDKAGATYLVGKVKALLANKVDVVAGKGLSTNDYTTTEKDKLAGIASGATAVIVDPALSASSTNAIQNKVVQEALNLKAPLISPGFSGTPTAPTAGSGTSTTQIATTQFVMDAVNAILSEVASGMEYKGTVGTGGTVTVLPATYDVGDWYLVNTAGTYAGQTCDVGDMIIAVVARSGSGNLNSDWTIVQTNLVGALTNVTGTAPISVTGTGASRAVAHSNSGITAGTYRSVTFNATGHATGGTNPTTLAGYGITDALASADLIAVTNAEIDAMFV